MIKKLNPFDLRLSQLVELIEIPQSHYELAVKRYQSLAEWFKRENSTVANFSPYIFSQGSFQFGTVIRPLTEREEYDLDLACQLQLLATSVTQQQLKELLGHEIKLYAKANNFKSPVEEKRRCWRLNYADTVSFHMDIVPAIPDTPEFIQALIDAGIDERYAKFSSTITDVESDCFRLLSPHWPKSNPNGYAKWFLFRMQEIAAYQLKSLVENRAYATVDDVPLYELKTPLQRCIQLLKRHRDIMYKDDPEFKPISIIITTLAAHAYNGESNIGDAMNSILAGMASYVQQATPRIANPANPLEDFADKWATNPLLERNFNTWLRQAQQDFVNISQLDGTRLKGIIEKKFNVNFNATNTTVPAITSAAVPAIHVPTPKVHITAPPSPWGK